MAKKPKTKRKESTPKRTTLNMVQDLETRMQSLEAICVGLHKKVSESEGRGSMNKVIGLKIDIHHVDNMIVKGD